MSNVPPDDEYPNGWGDDTGAVPLGPEPEPTGAGGPGGPGGWGEAPRTEPFAVAALVWAIVSVVIPLFGTIVAFVLAQRASDSIRRSQGTRRGEQLVTAARITAGAVLALWAIGLISFFALRSGDSNDNSDVAVPTQPPVSTTLAPITTVTTVPLSTTTTKPPVPSTTTPPPTVSVLPPSTLAPTTTPPTQAPTTTPPTEPPTTAPPTTIPDSQRSELLAQKLLAKSTLGPSNRGVPDDERFVVGYQAGQVLTVTWAIDNGVAPYPTGTATCTSPPTTTTTSPTSSTTSTTSTSSTTTTTTTTPGGTTTTTVAPDNVRTTSQQSRYEAKQILAAIKAQITALKLDFTDVQLIGTYPITGAGDDDVVQVLYSHQTANAPTFNYRKAFDVPPAAAVQCLNPAFAS